VHGVLTLPFLDFWLIATIMVIILGVGFSLVPAAMWPSVPKIIPEKQLGTAYALIFWIQNIGLWLIPLLLGIILDNTNPEVAPNKALIKDAIYKSYETELAGNTFNLSDKEIKKMAENANSFTIDSIVENSIYTPVSNTDMDQVSLKNDIAKVTSEAISSIETTGELKDYEDKILKTTVKAVYPVIESSKLNIRYDYFWDLVLFTCLGISSLFFAFLLKAEDRKKKYGLELPNIEDL
jgi:hypothetical protein